MKILDAKLSVFLHYFLIYLMLIIPGSCLFAKYLTGNMKYYVVLAFYAALYISDGKYRKPYTVLFLGFLLAMVVFTRIITNGGAGLSTWLQFAVCLSSVHFAILYDREHFLPRLLRTVVFFAVISNIFWALFLLFPELVELWPAPRFFVQSFGEQSWLKEYYAKGFLYYSFLDIHPTRNCGIYTELGVHQIVLNGALFLLLFWREKLNLKSEKQYVFYLTVTLLTIVTCQSTTGYLGLLLILFFYFFTQDVFGGIKMKIFVSVLMVLGLTVLLADYGTRGEESVLYKQFIEKLFGEEGNVDLSNSTGFYRLGSIIVSLQSVLEHPLGIGFDQFVLLKEEFADGLVAAFGITSMAVFGVVPWLIVNAIVFLPVFKNEKPSIAILFLLLFYNTTLAQTDWFYPLLMLVPIYYATRESAEEGGEGEEAQLYLENHLNEDLTFNDA